MPGRRSQAPTRRGRRPGACGDRTTGALALGVGRRRDARAPRLASLPLPLGNGEAYYYSWSRFLDWSYYDHPPLIAWMVRLTTALRRVARRRSPRARSSRRAPSACCSTASPSACSARARRSSRSSSSRRCPSSSRRASSSTPRRRSRRSGSASSSPSSGCASATSGIARSLAGALLGLRVPREVHGAPARPGGAALRRLLGAHAALAASAVVLRRRRSSRSSSRSRCSSGTRRAAGRRCSCTSSSGRPSACPVAGENTHQSAGGHLVVRRLGPARRASCASSSASSCRTRRCSRRCSCSALVRALRRARTRRPGPVPHGLHLAGAPPAARGDDQVPGRRAALDDDGVRPRRHRGGPLRRRGVGRGRSACACVAMAGVALSGVALRRWATSTRGRRRSLRLIPADHYDPRADMINELVGLGPGPRQPRPGGERAPAATSSSRATTTRCAGACSSRWATSRRSTARPPGAPRSTSSSGAIRRRTPRSSR